ncbi:TonB-dependent receptor plug domain-containing protein [Arcticibacterium luteifluviistationis]|uniref:TonB-dependent receptor plug domain-containing protein n=1 Tax=Arcticibacterium luteifluviistationis TaxID=1784714 RepID=A0A2Z4G805_9BACT|nr:TonB-dependent receptor plug domain-containing protein [Arcticibacterium luteifluviistationis]AWV97287.1 hypothetical protein DJ013_03525 [Arcticibacterium luteifluviistationis]
MKKLLLALSILCFAFTSALAQNSNIKVKVKDGPNPDIYIDGKKYDHAIMELLDQDKIASINVIKGKKALDEYNAPNGVIMIITKKSSDDDKNTEVKIRSTKEIKVVGYADADPMVIIDGKRSSKDALSKLSPDDIDSINVVKGEQAINKYKSPNGVIIVKTRSGEKN